MEWRRSEGRGSMKTRREVLKAGAATLAVGVPVAVVASGEAPINLYAGGITWVDLDYDERTGDVLGPSEMHEFTFHFLVTGDRDTARKVMNHFQSFIETSEGWPAKQTGINTSKITRV
jgi:hypothetical protein